MLSNITLTLIFSPHRILFGDQIEENEMGGTCSTYRGEENCIRGFGWET